MSVDFRHPQYVEHVERWTRARIAIEGEDAVKAADDLQSGTGAASGDRRFLPALSGQSEREYKAYKKRASFYGASGRTVQGLVGAMLMKEPTVEYPAEDQLEKITAENKSLLSLIALAASEVVGVGRFVLLVDAPRDADTPSIVHYWAENLINWRTSTVDGKQMPVLLVLAEENEEEATDDPFQTDIVEQRRVLRLVPSGDLDRLLDPANSDDRVVVYDRNVTSASLVYLQELWQKVVTRNQVGREEEEWVLRDVVVPRTRKGPFNHIPAVVLNPTCVGLEAEASPIMALINLNLSHYRNSADLEHGRHFTALPTPVVVGENVKEELRIGSQKAWVIEDRHGQAFFLEFTGAGLGHIQDGMDRKERLMAVLGSRLLEEQKLVGEAAEAIRLRQSGEKSVLGAIADVLSEGFTTILREFAQWIGVESGEVMVSLPKDFNVVKADPQLLTVLLQALQSGQISPETWAFNLSQNDILPPERAVEDEVAFVRDSALPRPEIEVDVTE